MAKMGRYCKAYYVRQLSAFPGWNPDLQQLRPAGEGGDDGEAQTIRTELREDDILFVQENFAVTDGVFLDENIVFNPGTAEWETFCRSTLGFEIPADLDDDAVAPPPAATDRDREAAVQTA